MTTADYIRRLYNARMIRDYKPDPHNDRPGETAYIIWLPKEETDAAI